VFRSNGGRCLGFLAALMPAMAQQTAVTPEKQTVVSQRTIDELRKELAAHEARIKELEDKLAQQRGQHTPDQVAPEPLPSNPPLASSAAPGQAAPAAATPADTAPPEMNASEGHPMDLAEGPKLKIHGFFDFNFGVGSIANPLVFPIIDNGCGTCGNPRTPPHTAFQAGEFDLFFNSKLSDHLSFLAEVVLGTDVTNAIGVDIERYQLTYRANRYFSASAGRFHTSIGYYNTAYHHGNWFSTAEGRPIMYLFEDSGGILPVHMVGVSFTGEIPHTESLGLHWVAEMGNGLSSNPFATEAVANFRTDRNYKATNLAAYMRPRSIPGLQIGGSWYHDGINPAQAQNPLPVGEIRQNIESAYIIYFSNDWEFMNEAVLLTNHLEGTSESFRSPMAYTQVARKFGICKPYFRYQYVNDSVRDPINLLKGTYYGPSIGMRIDFAEFAAFKLQFNHLFQSSQLAGNGLDAQVAFTF